MKRLFRQTLSLGVAAAVLCSAALPCFAQEPSAEQSPVGEVATPKSATTAVAEQVLAMESSDDAAVVALEDTSGKESTASGLLNGSFADSTWLHDNVYAPNSWTISGTDGAMFGKWVETTASADGDNYIVSAWSDSAYTAGLYQQVTGLAAGDYVLSVQTQSGGTRNSLFLYADSPANTSDNRVKKDISDSSAWTTTSLTFTVGADGTAGIGVWLDAEAGYWLNLDAVTLTLAPTTPEEPTGAVANGSFEDGTWEGSTYTLNDWALTGSMAASYAEDAKDGTYILQAWSDSTYTARAEQTVTGLEPGYYYLTAYAVKGAGDLGSDDQPVCYLYGSGSGQDAAMTMIPRRGVEAHKNDWTPITVRGIEVGSDGKATIGVYTEGNPGNWLKLDNIALTRETNQNCHYQLLMGGDVSMASWLEDSGAKFYDESGTEGDVLQILGENGFNIVRLRLYNNPGKGRGDGTYYCPEGYQDLDDILTLARRSKEKGLQIELSFHYSDYWSNAGTHNIPADWAAQIEGKTTEEAVAILENNMYSYTKEVLQAMKAQGTVPEYISLGNEMQNGILYPYGKASTDRWPYLARFLNAAAKAVRKETPNAKIILHSDDAGNDWKYNNFFGNCKTYGVDYDIMGISYYPFWVDLEVSDIVAFCNRMIDSYDKDIILMETGFNFNDTTANGKPGQLYHNGPYPYGGGASSPANQREFMAELFNGLKTVKDGRCIGDLYWDPIMVEQDGVGWAMLESTDTADVNVISNTALFDFDHKLLTTANAYRYNRDGSSIGKLSGKLVGENGLPIQNVAFTITLSGTDYTAATDAYGQFLLSLPIGRYTVDGAAVSGMTLVNNTSDFAVTADSNGNVTLTLQAASVSGVVLDGSNAPVSGATVTLQSADGANAYTAATDAAGQYAFVNVPAGGYTLTAAKIGYKSSAPATVTLTAGDTISGQNLTLTCVSGTVQGKVLDADGSALAGVIVKATADGHTTLTTQSDANGAYTLSGLEENTTYTLTYQKSTYHTEQTTVTAAVGQVTTLPDQALYLDQGSVKGCVVDKDGQPVAGATVTIGEKSTTTDASGNFTMTEIDAGSVTLTIRADNYMERSFTESITFHETTDAGKLILPAPITLQNPSFENDLQDSDWQLDGSGVLRQWRDTASRYDGEYALSFWSDTAFTASASQNVQGLSAGQYVFSIQSYVGMTHSQYADSELYLFLKNAAGKIIAQQAIPNTGTYLPIEMTFTIPNDGDYTIGIYANAISEDWAVFDMARLGYCGVPQTTPSEPETPTTPAQPKPSDPAPAPSQPETPAASGSTTQTTVSSTETNTTTASAAAAESPAKSVTSGKAAPAIPATGDTFPVAVLTLLAVSSAGMFLTLRKNSK